jgi:hypothetical protein
LDVAGRSRMPRAAVARHPSVAGLPELAKQDGDRFYTFPGESRSHR